MSKRLAGRYGYDKDNPFRVTWHPERLWEPMKWKKPRRIAVSLMGDLFHSNVPDHCIGLVFWIMGNARHHTFLLLTKRPQRILNKYPIWNNVQVGVSVENQETADERIPVLLQIPAAKRFVSIEPMLAPVELCWLQYGFLDKDHYNILDWVILGGETGPKARPMHPDWARSVRDQCQEARVPFFFKSWGDYYFRNFPASKSQYRMMWGRTWEEMP
jgi:protein gp37